VSWATAAEGGGHGRRCLVVLHRNIHLTPIWTLQTVAGQSTLVPRHRRPDNSVGNALCIGNVAVLPSSCWHNSAGAVKSDTSWPIKLYYAGSAFELVNHWSFLTVKYN
jgi:hypothetical protein